MASLKEIIGDREKDPSTYSLIIIDGANMAFKYEHGLRYLKNREGVQTGMFHGFLQLVLSLIIKNPTARLVIVWEGGKLVRKELMSSYKNGRKAKEEDFKRRERELKDMLGMMGVEQKYSPGYEADDVAACLAFERNGDRVLFVSGDRDWYQAMTPHTCVLKKSREHTYEDIMKAEGFPPERYDIYVALKGKSGNNVFGIPFFPTRLAREIVSRCKYIGDIYRYRSKEEKDYKWVEMISKMKDEINSTHNIIKLKTDVRLEDLSCRMKNTSQLKKKLVEMQMFRVLHLFKAACRQKRLVSVSISSQ